MSGDTVAWLVWIAAGALLEGRALATKRPGDTLSEHVWRWAAIREPRPTVHTWIGRALILIAGVWLTGHWAFGIWSIDVWPD